MAPKEKKEKKKKDKGGKDKKKKKGNKNENSENPSSTSKTISKKIGVCGCPTVVDSFLKMVTRTMTSLQ